MLKKQLIIVFTFKYLPYVDNISYIKWISNDIMVALVASIVTIGLNIIFFKNEFKEVINIFKNVLKRKKKSQAC